MTYTITYKDFYNNTTLIEISDGDDTNTINGETTHVLTPSATPLIIDSPTMSDIFIPSVGCGCRITVIASADDMLRENLFTYYIFKWSVTIKKNSVPVWYGYVTSETYKEDFSKNDDFEFEIQCTDGIALLDRLDYVDDNGDYYTGSAEIGQILANVLSKIPSTRGVRLCLSMRWLNQQSGSTILNGLSIDRGNFYAEPGTDETVGDPMTCREVLEEICKPFNLVSFYRGNTLMLVDFTAFNYSDTSNGLEFYDYQLTGGALYLSGSAYYRNNITNIQAGVQWIGGGQRLSLKPAYKDLTVKYSPYGEATIEDRDEWEKTDYWVDANEWDTPTNLGDWCGGYSIDNSLGYGVYLAHKILNGWSGISDYTIVSPGVWRFTAGFGNESTGYPDNFTIDLDNFDEVDAFARVKILENYDTTTTDSDGNETTTTTYTAKDATSDQYKQVLTGNEQSKLQNEDDDAVFGAVNTIGDSSVWLKYSTGQVMTGTRLTGTQLRLRIKFKGKVDTSGVGYLDGFARTSMSPLGVVGSYEIDHTLLCPAIRVKLGDNYYNPTAHTWTTTPADCFVRHAEEYEDGTSLANTWLEFSTEFNQNTCRDIRLTDAGKLEIQFVNKLLFATRFASNYYNLKASDLPSFQWRTHNLQIKDVEVLIVDENGDEVENQDISYEGEDVRDEVSGTAPTVSLKVGDSSVAGLPTDKAMLLTFNGDAATKFRRTTSDTANELQNVLLQNLDSQYCDTRFVLTGNLLVKDPVTYFSTTAGTGTVLCQFREPNLTDKRFALIAGKYDDRRSQLTGVKLLEILEHKTQWQL